MKPKENSDSGKQQQQPSGKRQMFLEKYGAAPLAFILRNPKMTPVMLFVLALAPFVIVAVVFGLVILSQQDSLTN